MATIIRSIAFKNFYNFYGEYEQNCYKFSEGLNIINADNGAGKSKIYNGFLWVIKGQVYDSDIRAIVKDDYEPLKLLSDKAKLENNEVETGVRIVFDNNGERYTVEKRIRYTKRIPNASTSNSDDWDISNAWVDVVCMNLASHDSHSIYDERDKEDILQNRLISPEMQSYALLQGEAIDEIVDLSNAKQLAHTVEILTDISELKSIETTCSILSRNAAHDLQVMQDAHTTNLGRYEALKRDKEAKLAFIEKCQESLDTYKYELKAASETYERLQSQVANTENRVKYRERLQTIEEKIKSLIERKSILLSGINDNLFKIDTPWLLLGTDGCIDSYLRLRDEYMQARYKRATAQDPHAFFTTLPEGSPYVIGRLLKGLKNGIILRVFEIVLKKLRMKMSLTYMFFLMVYNEMSRHFLKSIALRVMSQEFANKLKILMLKLQTSNVQNRLLQVNLSIMVETRII